MKKNFSELIIPAFHDFWKACRDPKYLNLVAKGGRNSSKSTTISMRMVYNRMKYRSHGLAVRKIDKTLRRSCREQLLWSIKHMGVEDSWKWSNTPAGDMTLTYIPTGASIFFEGANNAEKIKSYKMADMPITDLWFEELAEFKFEEEISTITNSFLREELGEGYYYKFFFSYNPPKRKQSWVNKKYESRLIPEHTYVHQSDYRDNPFVASFFVQEADHVKETNERRYNWEYLGLPIGSGVVPFDNLQFNRITDEQLEGFDNIRQGCDWGYSVDPVAFTRWHYDKTRKIIYAVDEIYKVKLSNEALAKEIIGKSYNKQETIADSAEPKSIAQLRNLDCNFTRARKGQGSVEYGEKWLDELEAIVIDPDRTPSIAWEFENIDYQVDKDGEPIARLDDKNNHTVDSARYAFENDMDERYFTTMTRPPGL